MLNCRPGTLPRHQRRMEKIRLGCKAASKSQHQMKSTKALQITRLILASAIMCGCQKQEDKSEKEAARHLKNSKTALTATHRKGEAFVVLKSDTVIYMADMRILCFKPDFSQYFAKWKQDWNTASRTQYSEIKNPELQAKLAALDNQITHTFTKASKAYEEFNEITEPFDRTLKKLQFQAQGIRSEQRTLASKTIKELNRHIVEAKLTVPKFKPDIVDELFATTEQRTYAHETEGEKRPMPFVFGFDPLESPFLVDKSPHNSRGSDWTFLVNIPADFEGTPIDSVIKASYKAWTSLQENLKKIEDEMRGQEIAKAEAIIPWESRHVIDHGQGTVLLSTQEEITASVKQITERLVSLKDGGKESSEVIEEEVQQRLGKFVNEVAVMQNQRKQLLEDAARTASLDLKREFRVKFHQLLKQQASSSVQTGSKGDFSVPADIAYLYAERNRENGETLVWLLRVDPNSPDIRMSNSNTTSGSEYDQFWMLDWTLD